MFQELTRRNESLSGWATACTVIPSIFDSGQLPKALHATKEVTKNVLVKSFSWDRRTKNDRILDAVERCIFSVSTLKGDNAILYETSPHVSLMGGGVRLAEVNSRLLEL